MDIQNVLMKVNIFDERHEMLEKYNTIWDIANNSIKKVFASELVYNEKYLKTKVKSYKGVQIFMIMECQKKVFIAYVY